MSSKMPGRFGRRGKRYIGTGPEKIDSTLLALYNKLNAIKFDGKLPKPHTLIFSNELTYLGGKAWWNYGRPVVKLSMLHSKSQGPKFVLETLLHEMVHLWVDMTYGRHIDGMHGPTFRRKAAEVGAPIHYDSRKTDPMVHRYVYQCPNCGRMIGRQRMMKVARSCGKCSPGVYREEFRFRLIKDPRDTVGEEGNIQAYGEKPKKEDGR